MNTWVWLAVGVLLVGYCASTPTHAEDWQGYAGGGPRRNASVVDVTPEKLAVSWVRRFDRQVVIGGDLSAPMPQAERDKWGSLNGAFGSRNLVLLDGRLAVITVDHTRPLPKTVDNTAWLTLLDSNSGKTVNCLQVAVKPGKAGIWGWPRAPWTDANDLLSGQVVLNWDKASCACYVSVGGDGACYTAYLPTANINTYVPGDFQPGVPAFQELYEQHAGLQDAFGRARTKLVSVYSSEKSTNPQLNESAAWGPSLVPQAAKGMHTAEDPQLPVLEPHPGWHNAGTYQNNVCNRTAFIALDTEGPLIAMGQSWHQDATSYYLANKWNGMYALATPLPGVRLIDEHGTVANYPHARPYAKWGGVLAYRNRLYGMSPGTDDNRDGQLGLTGGTSYNSPVWRQDQGLGLWEMDMRWEDWQPNDGVTGPTALETAIPTQTFGWSRASASTKPNDSHWEIDGLYRNKAMLVDSAGNLWATWTRASDLGIELVKANAQGQQGWLLETGKGRPGHEIWPHLALAEVGKQRWLVSYTGNAWHRGHGPYTLPFSNCNCAAGTQLAQAWNAEDDPPLGPAQLAVFDAVTEKVTQRLDFSTLVGDLPPNEFYGYTDRSHLVVAGHYAYVGWVSTKTGGEAELALCAVNLKSPQAKPMIRRFPLGFSAEKNPASALIDLIACNGRLYALMYRSDVLNYGDERWYEQLVMALGPVADARKR